MMMSLTCAFFLILPVLSEAATGCPCGAVGEGMAVQGRAWHGMAMAGQGMAGQGKAMAGQGRRGGCGKLSQQDTAAGCAGPGSQFALLVQYNISPIRQPAGGHEPATRSPQQYYRPYRPWARSGTARHRT